MRSPIKYYVTGHTAKGYVNYLYDNLQGINQIIRLTHPAKALKTDLFHHLIECYKDRFALEILLSESGSEFLEGVMIPELSLAIVSNTLIEEDSKVQSFDLEQYFSKTKQTKQFETELENLYKKSYDLLNDALQIHEELEAVYVKEMDFSKANQIADNFIENVLKYVPSGNQTSIVKRRLFGTNTYEGAINIVPDLLKRVKRRFYLKGRAGTGKSTFMRKVAKACKQQGLDIEVYHCSFDPKSIDMVLVPKASFCIFDSTGPHEFFPEKEGDEVIDLYKDTVTPGTDEKYQEKITSLTKKYRKKINLAMETLQQSKIPQMALEKEYTFTKQEIENLFFELKRIIK